MTGAHSENPQLDFEKCWQCPLTTDPHKTEILIPSIECNQVNCVLYVAALGKGG